MTPLRTLILLFLMSLSSTLLVTYYSQLQQKLVSLSLMSFPDEENVSLPGSERISGNDDHSTVRDFLRRASRYSYRYPVPRSNEQQEKASQVCGTGPDFGDYWKQKHPGPPMTALSRSVNNEDRTIYERFFKKGLYNDTTQNFTYVELGAYNGLTESNSRFFDDCLGWEGLLIEANPNPFVYPKLVEHRPHAHRMNFAASCAGSLEHSMGFYNKIWTNSAQVGTKNPYGNESMVQVPCGSLTPVLLDIFPNGHVTFFSLDVEGAEPYVLQHLDWSRVFVELWMVESYNQFCPQEPAHCESRAQFRAILEQAGYKLYKDVIQKSDLFIHPKSQFYY